jgi:prohibitin 1
MQTVSLTLRVLHRPDHDKLHEIYSNLGLDYEERVLPSIGNEVLKAVVAQFDASELITQREQVWGFITNYINRIQSINRCLKELLAC